MKANFRKRFDPRISKSVLAIVFGMLGLSMALTGIGVLETGYPPNLPVGSQCTEGISPSEKVDGITQKAIGSGIVMASIGRRISADLVLMTYDGANFNYKIGWDPHPASLYVSPSQWTTPFTVAGNPFAAGSSSLKWRPQTASMSVADIDKNGRSDFVLVAYGAAAIVMPSGEVLAPAKFYYRIGWNADENGFVSTWSDFISVPGMGNKVDGVGVAMEDLDRNGSLDMMLMVYRQNTFFYKNGKDLGADGKATDWTYSGNVDGVPLQKPAGAGITIADIDLDGAFDLVLMAYGQLANSEMQSFNYRVGWALDSDAKPKKSSRWFMLSGVGKDATACGLQYLHKRMTRGRSLNYVAWIQQLVFMAYDKKTDNSRQFRYFVLPLTTSGATFAEPSDYAPLINYGRPQTLSVPSSGDDETGEKLFNINMREVQFAAWDALSLFTLHCQDVETAGQTESHPECWYKYPDSSLNFISVFNHPHFSYEKCPDYLVAAVAWYVANNMKWVADDINTYVLNDIHGLGYSPGGEGMPAYYIVQYTDPTKNPNLITSLESKNPDWALQYNDGKIYHGDCEDFAILRHALLRALGFDKRFIWNAFAPVGINEGHEFNVVLYNGAYRIMDYGPIVSYLCASSYITARIVAAWNEANGPRISGSTKEYFNELVLKRIYPDRCWQEELAWLFTRLPRPDFEGNKNCVCK